MDFSSNSVPTAPKKTVEDLEKKNEESVGETQTVTSTAATHPATETGSEEPPDGGYGWVVVGCMFLSNAVTWGVNSTFGVFLSFYTRNNFFPDATDVDFAVIGGLAVGCAMIMAPFSNYLSKSYNFKVPLSIGVVVYVLSQVFAGLSVRIWQLFLTQGVMFGIGLGLIFIPTVTLGNEWFSKKRAYATGLLAGGSGAGTIIFSQVTKATITKLGLRWAFIINGVICLVVLVPVVILLKSRSHVTRARFEPMQYQLLWHPGFFWILLWGSFTTLGYTLSLYTAATYATVGLGLSQSQAAAVQSIIAAGQIVGRPISGYAMDKGGRFNIAILWTAVAGLSCLVIWIVSRSFGVLAFFSIIQGMTGGIFWSASGTLTTEIVGLKELGSALSILWLTIVPSCIFAEPIAVWLLQASQRQLRIPLPDGVSGQATGTTAAVSGAGTGNTRGAIVFEATIGFAGATFIVGSILLYFAKRWKQGNWKLLVKT